MNIETHMCVGLVVLLVYLVFFMVAIADYKSHPKETAPLLLMFGSAILHLVIGLWCDYYDDVHSHYKVQYVLCSVYPILGYFELYSYGKYYTVTCGAKPKTVRLITRVNQTVFAVNVLSTIALIPTGLFFQISEDCVYTRGPLFFLSYLFVFLEIVFLDIVTVTEVRADAKKAFGYLCFGLLPFVVSGCMLVAPLPGLANDVATLISCALLYSFIYVEERNKALENEVKMVTYKTDVMLSQIGPHFIYNTLSTISALCNIDPEKAQTLTAEFSDYLRENLMLAKTRRLSTFEEELNHTRTYLGIEQVRFGNRLNVEYDIGETAFNMPSLSLQPIVENAVKHGITAKDEGGTIRIITESRKEHFAVIVDDDGVGFDAESWQPNSGHYGLFTAKERLELLLNGTIEIKSRIGHGTTITMLIPKERGAIQ